jgi:hypothetical protein
MPYRSMISGRLEHRPIASTLIGAIGWNKLPDFCRSVDFLLGSDLMLWKLRKQASKQRPGAPLWQLDDTCSR